MEAMISGSAGLALLMDSEQMFSIHVDEPERTVPRHPAEYRYLTGEARDFITVEFETREELVSELLLARDCEDSLHLVLIAQDVTLSDGVRREAVDELEELLQDGNVGAYLENVLYSHPLPDGIDLAGALRHARGAEAREVQALLELCWTHQDAIREVREAWESIPFAEFEGENDHWRATVVREGAFRDLARYREEGDSLNSLFKRIGARPRIRTLPNYQSVLQRWLDSIRRLRAAAELENVAAASVVCEPRADEYGSGIRVPQEERTGKEEGSMTTEQAVALAYEELCWLPAAYLRKERGGHTLDPAGLVHEANMRLMEKTGTDWRNQEHFVGAMARAMRQYLVDHARRRNAEKRGGVSDPLTLTAARSLTEGPPPSLTRLDDALRDLEELDPAKARLVELHFFGGLTFDEIAKLKHVARSTIFEEWKKARLWLFKNLKKTVHREPETVRSNAPDPRGRPRPRGSSWRRP